MRLQFALMPVSRALQASVNGVQTPLHRVTCYGRDALSFEFENFRMSCAAIGALRILFLCSDKLARWCVMGIQGALLHQLLEEPIRISSLTSTCIPPLAEQDTSQAWSALERAVSGKVYSCRVECLQDHILSVQVSKGMSPSKFTLLWATMLQISIQEAILCHAQTCRTDSWLAQAFWN